MHAPVMSAVGFDLDNTLYDQTQHVVPFFSVAAARLQEQTGVNASVFERTLWNAWQKLGPSHPKLFDFVLNQQGCYSPETVRMLVHLYHDYAVGPLKPYPGVRSLLSRLSRRFPLFLITDGNAATQRQKIDRLRIASRFRVIVLSDECGVSKPDRVPFVTALRQLECPPGACLFVGDNPTCDIAGAAQAGMRTVRVLTGPFRSMRGDSEPDFTIDSVTEIENVIHAG